jgi:hypothetical protein
LFTCMYFPCKIGHFLENGGIWMINHHIFKVFQNTICLAYIPETMRLKQRRLNLINFMQVKKILFTNVFFPWSLCLLNMLPSMVFPKHLYFFRFVHRGLFTLHHHIFKVFQNTICLAYIPETVMNCDDDYVNKPQGLVTI